MSRSIADENAAAQPHPQQRKRRSDAGEELRTRSSSSSSFGGQQQPAATPIMRQNPLELRAFGLEDRADAVISTGATGWSLRNLSQWRQELVSSQQPTPSPTSGPGNRVPLDYVAARQRLFKQQMLRSARQPPSGSQ